MTKAMNNLKIMKVSEIDRINKLIEKTENDIAKIDHEIKCEKVRKTQVMLQEQQDHQNNLLKRRKAYVMDCTNAFQKMQLQLKEL